MDKMTATKVASWGLNKLDIYLGADDEDGAEPRFTVYGMDGKPMRDVDGSIVRVSDGKGLSNAIANLVMLTKQAEDSPQTDEFIDVMTNHADDIDLDAIYDGYIPNLLAFNRGRSVEQLFCNALEYMTIDIARIKGVYTMRSTFDHSRFYDDENGEPSEFADAREVARSLSLSGVAFWGIVHYAEDNIDSLRKTTGDILADVVAAQSLSKAVFFVEDLANGSLSERLMFKELADKALTIDAVARHIDEIQLRDIANDNVSLFVQALDTTGHELVPAKNGYHLRNTINGNETVEVFTTAQRVVDVLAAPIRDCYISGFAKAFEEHRDAIDSLDCHTANRNLSDLSLWEWVQIYNGLRNQPKSPELQEVMHKYKRDFNVCETLSLASDLVNINEAYRVMGGGKGTTKTKDDIEKE